MPSSINPRIHRIRSYRIRDLKRQFIRVWPRLIDIGAMILLMIATFVAVLMFANAVMPQELDRGSSGGDCRKIDSGIVLELRREGGDKTLTIARYQIMQMIGDRCLPPDVHTWGVTRCFVNLKKQTLCKDVPFVKDPRDSGRIWFRADSPGIYTVGDLPSVSFAGPDPSLDYSAHAYFQHY